MREQGKTFHEVEKTGSLYFLINALIGAYNRRTDAVSSGFHAIALALSTKEDNSAEIKALTDKLKQSSDLLKEAVDNQKGK